MATRKPKAPAAPPAGQEAAAQPASASASSPGAQASEDASASIDPAANQDGAGASSSGEGAPSLQSDASSNDNPAERAAAEASADASAHPATLSPSAEAAAPAEDEGEEESLLGSSVLPAIIEIGHERPTLGEIVVATHQMSGVTVAQWNAMSEATREAILGLVVATYQAAASVEGKVRDMAAAAVAVQADEQLVAVIAKGLSKDTFWRAGLQWGGVDSRFRAETVTVAQERLLKADPRIEIGGPEDLQHPELPAEEA